MKEILKTFIPQIPIIIVVLLLMWMMKGNQISYSDVMNQLNQRDSIISQVIDNQGRLVTTHTNRPYNKSVIRDSKDPEMEKLKDELKKNNIALKDLQSAINLQAVASGEGATKIVHDTLDTYSFNDTISSKFLQLKGTIDLKADTLKYDYSYTANYSIYSYQYKKKFWKRPEMRIKLVSDDPSNLIKMQTFSIKPPQEIISIGVGFGAAFYYADGKFGVAPAITIGIFKPIYTFRTKK